LNCYYTRKTGFTDRYLGFAGFFAELGGFVDCFAGFAGFAGFELPPP